MQVKVEGDHKEPSYHDYVGKNAIIWTLETDPLIGNNLRVDVAASSPCIGQYKLTCLQNDSVLLSPAGFELSSAKP